jgi:protein-S-isoprenylcysteine O-methyltransferase Ste14
MVVLELLLFTILVPGAAAVLILYLLLPPGSVEIPTEVGGSRLLGVLSIVLGALIYAWCARDFALTDGGTPVPIDPPKALVSSGHYRFVRNPMHVGVILVLFGEALLFKSTALLVYAGSVLLGFHLMVVLYEEPTLGKQFGESYGRYRRAVPRWIPRVKGRPGPEA